jgi:hypothetical protein
MHAYEVKGDEVHQEPDLLLPLFSRSQCGIIGQARARLTAGSVAAQEHQE